MRVTRRGILVGGLVGGGLAVGWLLRPRSFPLPLQPGPDEQAFDAWIKISRQGVVTVAVPQVEMGQGITTLLPQIVAMELGADWRQVAVEPAPVSAHYANTVLAARWGEMWLPAAPRLVEQPEDLVTRRWAEDNRFNVTADGTALAAYEAPARAAAASTRALLMQAAAQRWDVAWEECTVADGLVRHGEQTLPFGALVEAASRLDPPDVPPLQPVAPAEDPSDFPPGAELAFPRLDLPSKIDGSWTFAGDVRLPGMLHAAIRHGPIASSSRLETIDEARGKDVRGFERIVKGETQGVAWVAALASNGWAAETALERMQPLFRFAGGVDSAEVETALDTALRDGHARRVFGQGEMDLTGGALPLQLRYEVAPALHAGIETAAATARLEDGLLELWIGTQAPEAARRMAAEAAGLSPSQVVLYPMALGGSFDRRLEVALAGQVARLAREAGRPVQLVWSRAEEHRAGFPRTPAVAVMAGRPDTNGGIGAWRARIAVPASAREFGRRLIDGDTSAEAIAAVDGEEDALVLEGAVPVYAIPHVEIDHVPARIALPTGRLRGNAHGYTAFFTECFFDEMAHRHQREPLALRMALLGQTPRLAECLQRVASLAQWDGGADQSGQGLACHALGGGYIAAIASVRREEGGVKVERLSAVADIGRIVNTDIARQQIEGGLLFGLGLALGCSTRYVKGRPQTETLGELGLPTLRDTPEIEVAFVTSDAEPVDPGELGVAVAAPALANALFSATGLRFRRLPLFSEEL
ncbi:molybdopterin cofactor-binding domain-containing protein [Novosphingobium mangrovi (ex Hu et al. 2023)]|uniref:Molybdopterin-dependent oxidoreductase n=1 Tax=Novosphingobium mangrovi (ex Hu et al. 2023) TaxID=2930094 RepID=A0ABT0ACZ9_9SPHN|nr:molybdopterin cofactor-binding domain-containing protein [Novosphingobium mangrovi (ex Hu et al. 2023)]MCJ1961072.1 molybdopterin-dependent oxidoreductase [Novosphingobium mangrovi (ex Hu et al. 2023)]